MKRFLELRTTAPAVAALCTFAVASASAGPIVEFVAALSPSGPAVAVTATGAQTVGYAVVAWSTVGPSLASPPTTVTNSRDAGAGISNVITTPATPGAVSMDVYIITAPSSGTIGRIATGITPGANFTDTTGIGDNSTPPQIDYSQGQSTTGNITSSQGNWIGPGALQLIDGFSNYNGGGPVYVGSHEVYGDAGLSGMWADVGKQFDFAFSDFSEYPVATGMHVVNNVTNTPTSMPGGGAVAFQVNFNYFNTGGDPDNISTNTAGILYSQIPDNQGTVNGLTGAVAQTDAGVNTSILQTSVGLFAGCHSDGVELPECDAITAGVSGIAPMENAYGLNVGFGGTFSPNSMNNEAIHIEGMVASAGTVYGIHMLDAMVPNDFDGPIMSATVPTLTAGCGGTLSAGSNIIAGLITAITTTGTCNITLTFPMAAPHGYACSVSDRTTGNLMRQTSATTTTAVLTGVTVSGDAIQYNGCGLY